MTPDKDFFSVMFPVHRSLISSSGIPIPSTTEPDLEEMLSNQLEANFKANQIKITEAIQAKLLDRVSQLDAQDIYGMLEALSTSISLISRSDEIYNT